MVLKSEGFFVFGRCAKEAKMIWGSVGEETIQHWVLVEERSRFMEVGMVVGEPARYSVVVAKEGFCVEGILDGLGNISVNETMVMLEDVLQVEDRGVGYIVAWCEAERRLEGVCLFVGGGGGVCKSRGHGVGPSIGMAEGIVWGGSDIFSDGCSRG